MADSVNLLVVGTSVDPHVTAVLDKLPDAFSVARLDVDAFPREMQISLYPACRKPQLVLHGVDTDVDITNPDIVWFRRLGAPGLPDNIPEKYRRFSLGEADHALEGLLSLVQPGAWINEYWSTRQAANKPSQYAMAARAGLQVPTTVITNNPGVAQSWLANVPRAIIKSIHSPMITYPEAEGGRSFAFTHYLTNSDRSDLDDIATTPCQFQPLIEKAYELRVTSIGGQHFAVRIDTQENSGEVHDWRPVAQECKYSAFELSEDVVSSLDRLLASLNIQYAASDFIVTPTGEVIFLEANPHGAWLWLEDEVPGLEIAKAFADYLSVTALPPVR